MRADEVAVASDLLERVLTSFYTEAYGILHLPLDPLVNLSGGVLSCHTHLSKASKSFLSHFSMFMTP